MNCTACEFYLNKADILSNSKGFATVVSVLFALNGPATHSCYRYFLVVEDAPGSAFRIQKERRQTRSLPSRSWDHRLQMRNYTQIW